jgi:hypothetical protein
VLGGDPATPVKSLSLDSVHASPKLGVMSPPGSLVIALPETLLDSTAGGGGDSGSKSARIKAQNLKYNSMKPASAKR